MSAQRDASYFARKAHHCRALAESLNDTAAMTALLQLAAKFDRQAAEARRSVAAASADQALPPLPSTHPPVSAETPGIPDRLIG